MGKNQKRQKTQHIDIVPCAISIYGERERERDPFPFFSCGIVSDAPTSRTSSLLGQGTLFIVARRRRHILLVPIGGAVDNPARV